jgi:RNA-binding protein
LFILCYKVFYVDPLGDRLKRLGKVLHISPSTRNIIVKSFGPAQVGSKVFDGEMGKVGVVFDILGPLSAPYISVKPNLQNPEKLIKRTLFQLEKREEKMR